MSKSYSKSLSKSKPKSLAEKLKWGFCIIASIAILALLIYIITKDDNKTGGPNMSAPNVLSAAETDQICQGYKGCIVKYDEMRDLDCSTGVLKCKDGFTDECDLGGKCVKQCGVGFTKGCDNKTLTCSCDDGIECNNKCEKISCNKDKGLTAYCDTTDNQAKCKCSNDKQTLVNCADDNNSQTCIDVDPKCGDKSAVYNCQVGCCKCQDPNPVFNYTKNTCQA